MEMYSFKLATCQMPNRNQRGDREFKGSASEMKTRLSNVGQWRWKGAATLPCTGAN